MPREMSANFNAGPNQDIKWDQFAPRYKWKKGWQRLRVFGLVYTDARHHNIATKSGKAYAEFCHGYDVENDRYFSDRTERCECCKVALPTQIRHFVNVFSLDDWERRPANPPTDWTPVYLADLAPGLMRAIVELKIPNNGYMVGDPLKGAIINVKFDPDAPSPSQMYGVSVDSKQWAFEPDMCKLVLSQESPDGKRHVLRGTDVSPPQYVYYPCRSDRDRMVASLRRNGYLDTLPEATAEVSSRAASLVSSLTSSLDDDEPVRPRAGGVKQLAQLREEDATPPPKPTRAAAAPVEVEYEDDSESTDIPF